MQVTLFTCSSPVSMHPDGQTPSHIEQHMQSLPWCILNIENMAINPYKAPNGHISVQKNLPLNTVNTAINKSDIPLTHNTKVKCPIIKLKIC